MGSLVMFFLWTSRRTNLDIWLWTLLWCYYFYDNFFTACSQE